MERRVKVTVLDKWCDRVWLWVIYAIGIVMLCVICLNWNAWSIAEKLMGILTVLLPVHVFEENTFPGGFPYMNNVTGKSTAPMVYPQNKFTNMITNLASICWIFTQPFTVNDILLGVCIVVSVVGGFILLPLRISAKKKSKRFMLTDIGYFIKFH